MFSRKSAPEQKMSEELILGHLIKYNIYLLAKSVVFSAVMSNVKDASKAAEQTNKVMDLLDLNVSPKE